MIGKEKAYYKGLRIRKHRWIAISIITEGVWKNRSTPSALCEEAYICATYM